MEIPHEVSPRRDTGLFNSKLGVWLFLASEVMLFGGLFSAYVFLRVGVVDGVDTPWPWGVNVHKTFVLIGFINTVILIVSSVFVVFGWVALKERNFRRFQMYMFLTVACAAVFMGLKTVEYRSKLTQSHDVRLKDNSLLEGKILGNSDQIPFEATGATFNLLSSVPGFVHDLEGEFPQLTVKWTEGAGDGKEVRTEEVASASAFRTWFIRAKGQVSKELARERKRYRAEIAAKERALYQGVTDFEEPKLPDVTTTASFTAAEPFAMTVRRTRVSGTLREEGGDDTLTYRDGTSLKGVLGDDRILFLPKYVDLQLVPLHQQDGSLVWDVLDDPEAKKNWFKNRDSAYAEMESYFSQRNREIPEKMLRGYFINLQSIHDKADQDPYFQRFLDKFLAGMGLAGGAKEKALIEKVSGTREPSEKGGAEASGEKGSYHVIQIPRELVKFMNSHGPRNNNYYALYFTMTALHGLHVVGGALVLLYFTVFGKRLYRKNPEHLANRVEVGGLFWHFVDLIWIFLFPLMYLL